MRKSNRRFIAVLIALAVCTMAHAWSYDSEAATTTQAAQLRFGAGFTKKWNNGIRLGVSEEIAMDDACKVEHDLSKETFEALCRHVEKYSAENAD